MHFQHVLITYLEGTTGAAVREQSLVCIDFEVQILNQSLCSERLDAILALPQPIGKVWRKTSGHKSWAVYVNSEQ